MFLFWWLIVSTFFSGAFSIGHEVITVRWGLFQRRFSWAQVSRWQLLPNGPLRFDLVSGQSVTARWRYWEVFDGRQNLGSLSRRLERTEIAAPGTDDRPLSRSIIWSRVYLTSAALALVVAGQVIGAISR